MNGQDDDYDPWHLLEGEDDVEEPLKGGAPKPAAEEGDSHIQDAIPPAGTKDGISSGFEKPSPKGEGGESSRILPAGPKPDPGPPPLPGQGAQAVEHKSKADQATPAREAAINKTRDEVSKERRALVEQLESAKIEQKELEREQKELEREQGVLKREQELLKREREELKREREKKVTEQESRPEPPRARPSSDQSQASSAEKKPVAPDEDGKVKINRNLFNR